MVRLGANRAVEGWAKLAKTKCTLIAYISAVRTAEFGRFLTHYWLTAAYHNICSNATPRAGVESMAYS